MTIGKVSRVIGMIKKLLVYSDWLDIVAFKIIVIGNLLLEMQVPVKRNK